MPRSASSRARSLALAGGLAATLLLTACGGSTGTAPAAQGSSGSSATADGGASSDGRAGDQPAAISRAIVQLKKELYGKGPDRARTGRTTRFERRSASANVWSSSAFVTPKKE